jgi:hypothetical protein
MNRPLNLRPAPEAKQELTLPKVKPGKVFGGFIEWVKDSGMWPKFKKCRDKHKINLRNRNHKDPDMSLDETALLLAGGDFGFRAGWRRPDPDRTPEESKLLAESAKAFDSAVEAPKGKQEAPVDSKVDYDADVAECYCLLEVSGLVKKDFQRAGAFTFWRLCQRNQKFKEQFLKDIAPKVFSKTAAQDDESSLHRDAELLIKNLDAFEQLSRECQET